MRISKLKDAPEYNPEKYVAEEFLQGNKTNVRIIRLAPGIALPPHKHGESDLMLYVVEGSAILEEPYKNTTIEAGALVFVDSSEELRVRNEGSVGVTFLAFLAPSFPPR